MILSLSSILGLYGQATIEVPLPCVNQDDAFIGLDRKSWTTDMSVLSESYQNDVMIPLDPPNGLECVTLTGAIVEISNHSENNNIDAAFPGCYLSLWTHVLEDCNSNAPISCSDALFDEEGFHPSIVLDETDVEDLPGTTLGVDIVTVINISNCNQTQVSDGNYSATFDVCVTLIYTYNEPDDSLDLPSTVIFCNNDIFDYEGPDGYDDYLWEGPNNEEDFDDILNNVTTGFYTLTVTDDEGCTDTGEIEFIPSDIPTIAYNQNNPFIRCTGSTESVSIVANNIPDNTDYNYKWESPSGISSTGISIIPLEVGTYSVTVTDSDTNCDHISSINVAHRNVAQALIDSIANVTNITVCQGINNTLDAFINPSDMNNYSYEWINGLDTFSTKTISIINDGQYILNLGNDLGCPISSDTIIVTIANKASAGTDSSSEICIGGFISLTNFLPADADPFGQWYFDNFSIISSTSVDASTLQGNIRFNYVVPNVLPCVNDTSVITINFRNGLPCNDGDPNNNTDVIQDDCSCAGEYECPTLQLNIGDACDDNNPETMDDQVQSDCSCLGNYDCPTLMANIDDVCNDNNALTDNDRIQSDCSCSGGTVFDCPVLLMNIGDSCDDGISATNNDIIQSDCSCSGQYDCSTLMLNIGDSCDDNDPDTMNDIIQINCTCNGKYDCPTLSLNIGDPCNDNAPATSNDVIQSDCSCRGNTTFDCTITMLNIGDVCDDGDAFTFNDVIQLDCSCQGEYDCPSFMLNIGDICDDGNMATINDVIQSDCSCTGLYDCPSLMLNIGDTCDDNDSNTIIDLVQNDCSCSGEMNFDCPILMLNTGDACNDGIVDTINDIVQNDCSCSGNIIFDCPTQMLNTGDTCDDGNIDTINDIIQSDCTCQGNRDFDCPVYILDYGDSCDDNNTETINDVILTDCSCSGVFDCNNSTFNPEAKKCDDGIDCTVNDIEVILSDGTICQQCLGEFQDCNSGFSFVRNCDDGNTKTLNDIETVLECDNRICIPCSGTLETSRFYIPTAFAPKSSTDALFGIYGHDPISIREMTIYDRWGNSIYNRKNVVSTDLDGKWNGRYKNGNLVQQGVYIYVINFTVNGADKRILGDISVFY